MANGAAPIIGTEYLYREVAGFVDHDPVFLHWVLIKDVDVVGLRLREDFNPNIFKTRPEVWVGADSPTCIWGGRLKNIKHREQKAIPVFVKRTGRRKYEYIGQFQYDDEIAAPHSRCQAAAGRVPHKRGISRIVYLKAS